ncbi:MAG: phospholipase D family protein [Planctomycetes bacterium]|nr:phospholipase D family protein [Planctomycetota bacterium]
MSAANELATLVEQAILEAAHRRAKAAGPTEIAELIARLMTSSTTDVAAQQLARSILDGINRAAERLDDVRVAVTGIGWVGGGIGSVEDAMISALKQAQREILLTAYRITTGSSRVIDELERSVATGIRTSVVVDRLDDQEPIVRDRLQSLSRQFPKNLLLYDFAGFDANGHLHAKTLVVDRQLAVVGSANLSFPGMMTAHELAVIIEGPSADLIAGRIDLLLQSRDVHAIR